MYLIELFQIVESKIDILASKYSNKLIAAYKADMNRDIEGEDEVKQLIDQLGAADPTKKALEWVVRMYSDRQFKIEDISRIGDDLNKFRKYKSSITNKDINSYKTLSSLYDVIDKIDAGTEVVSGKKEKKNKTKAFFDSGQAEKLYRDANVIVIAPKTEAASCHIGMGTKWCTAGNKDNQFDHYMAKSQLYVVIIKGKKYQFQLTPIELKDDRDISISWRTFLDTYEDVGIRKILSSSLGDEGDIFTKDTNALTDDQIVDYVKRGYAEILMGEVPERVYDEVTARGIDGLIEYYGSRKIPDSLMKYTLRRAHRFPYDTLDDLTAENGYFGQAQISQESAKQAIASNPKFIQLLSDRVVTVEFVEDLLDSNAITPAQLKNAGSGVEMDEESLTNINTVLATRYPR